MNGRIVDDPERWVDSERDAIALDGTSVRDAAKTYWLVHKPKGYLTTYRDPQGRKTVYDLIPDRDRYLFPVGRLDLETSGLLVMTNDSAFAERLTSPEHEVPKSYLAKVSARLTEDQLEALRRGVALRDGLTRRARVTRVRESGGRTIVEITITEGRNRQVRRMVEAVGAKVLALARIAIGPLRIGDLAVGGVRPLTRDEVRRLTAAGAAVRGKPTSSRRPSRS